MIAIPSRGRQHQITKRQKVLMNLHPSLREHIFVFNHVEDEDNYRIPEILERVNDVITLGYPTIGDKRRQMAVEAKKRGYKKIMMLDDDVSILIRRAPDNWQLRYSEGDETVEMYKYVSTMLDHYGQVALGAREGNNQLGLGGPADVVDCIRSMRSNSFNVEEFLSLKHDRVPVMEDFDIQLQLLGMGRPTAVTVYWATGQSGTNVDGGCSLWRTHELHENAVYRLMELHPGSVHPYLKKNKTGGEFGTRVEARISWLKTYEHAIAKMGKMK